MPVMVLYNDDYIWPLSGAAGSGDENVCLYVCRSLEYLDCVHGLFSVCCCQQPALVVYKKQLQNNKPKMSPGR